MRGNPGLNNHSLSRETPPRSYHPHSSHCSTRMASTPHLTSPSGDSCRDKEHIGLSTHTPQAAAAPAAPCVLSCQLCTHPDAVARHTCPFGEAEVMGKGRRASMKSGRARGERHQLCGVCCPGGGTQGTGSLLSIPPVWAAWAAQPPPCWICSGIPALGQFCQPFPAAAREPGCAEQTPGSGGWPETEGRPEKGSSSTPLTSSPLRNRREEMARRRMGGGGGGVRRRRNKERSGGRAAAGGGGEWEEGWGGRRSSRGGGCRGHSRAPGPLSWEAAGGPSPTAPAAAGRGRVLSIILLLLFLPGSRLERDRGKAFPLSFGLFSFAVWSSFCFHIQWVSLAAQLRSRCSQGFLHRHLHRTLTTHVLLLQPVLSPWLGTGRHHRVLLPMAGASKHCARATLNPDSPTFTWHGEPGSCLGTGEGTRDGTQVISLSPALGRGGDGGVSQTPCTALGLCPPL